MTKHFRVWKTFVLALNHFKVIALTHRHLGLDLVGKFHVEPDEQKSRFEHNLSQFEIKEFMFLSTCNRVEFFFRSPLQFDQDRIIDMFTMFYPKLSAEDIDKAAELSRLHHGPDAIRHIFHVASSLDSLIIGEREIITQVRLAYERAHKNGFTGDFIRIGVQKAIETAKQIYTETEIATKPISVVNLAYRQLIVRDLTKDHSIVYVGAGQTIEAIAGNLKKHDFKSVKVFNRTKEKAEALASIIDGEGFGLNEFAEKAGHFDVLVTCTGSENAIFNAETFKKIGITGKKIIVDLAIPNDIDRSILSEFDIDYISIEQLKEEAKRNLKEREKEVFRCEQLVEMRIEEFETAFKNRKLELAMQEIPQMMKDIKLRALDKTFAKDVNALDPKSKETLDKILNYLEKKYISIPMKMAKQVVLEQDLKDPIIE